VPQNILKLFRATNSILARNTENELERLEIVVGNREQWKECCANVSCWGYEQLVLGKRHKVVEIFWS